MVWLPNIRDLQNHHRQFIETNISGRTISAPNTPSGSLKWKEKTLPDNLQSLCKVCRPLTRRPFKLCVLQSVVSLL